ncbi:MAG: DNA cytosine methyltransferase [Candidatus Methylumidiphilus sp.]
MKSLELFSGAGGLAKGLENAGFSHAAFVEFNTHACASLRQNFDAEKVFFGDVRDFDLDSLHGIDVVAGGPPCQPFSLGGKHRAQHDSRDMFPYAIRAIEKLAPKAFVFENVKGLLRTTFSEYFEFIRRRLAYPGYKAAMGQDWREHLEHLRKAAHLPYAGLRYDVSCQLLNAADYGVPQQRERVVIVGLRSDLGLQWEFPAATHAEDSLLWDMCVSKNYWARHGMACPKIVSGSGKLADKAGRLSVKYGFFEPELLPWRTIRDALCGVVDPREPHAIADHIFRDGARVYPGHTGSDIDWPSKTIKAGGHGVPGGENMLRYPDGSVRYFTVFEAKRIQTFPDDFIITGAWGEAMRQIGNAVPVRLAEIIASHLANRLAQTQMPATTTAVRLAV